MTMRLLSFQVAGLDGVKERGTLFIAVCGERGEGNPVLQPRCREVVDLLIAVAAEWPRTLTPTTAATLTPAQALRLALALSWGPRCLGITRFSYDTRCCRQRADLGWNYARRRNEHRECGRLPARRTDDAGPHAALRPVALLVGGAVWASLFMVKSGFFFGARYCCSGSRQLGRYLGVRRGRLAGGAAGRLAARRARAFCWVFITAARDWGITLSALLIWRCCRRIGQPHSWAWALVGAGWPASCTAVLAPSARTAHGGARRAYPRRRPNHPPRITPVRRWMGPCRLHALRCRLSAADLRDRVVARAREAGDITAFYALLGLACVASSRLWAGLPTGFAAAGRRRINALQAWRRCCRCGPAWPVAWLRGSCSARCSCRWWHRLPHSCAAICRPRSGRPASSAFTSPLPPGNRGAHRDRLDLRRRRWPGSWPVASAITLWAGALLASRQRALLGSPLGLHGFLNCRACCDVRTRRSGSRRRCRPRRLRPVGDGEEVSATVMFAHQVVLAFRLAVAPFVAGLGGLEGGLGFVRHGRLNSGEKLLWISVPMKVSHSCRR